jgi:hypothetical protein
VGVAIVVVITACTREHHNCRVFTSLLPVRMHARVRPTCTDIRLETLRSSPHRFFGTIILAWDLTHTRLFSSISVVRRTLESESDSLVVFVFVLFLFVCLFVCPAPNAVLISRTCVYLERRRSGCNVRRCIVSLEKLMIDSRLRREHVQTRLLAQCRSCRVRAVIFELTPTCVRASSLQHTRCWLVFGKVCETDWLLGSGAKDISVIRLAH